jgi:hypothetical protein
MQDVSDTGARLKISNPRGTAKIDLPDSFVLAISRSGNVFRRCKLIWRRNDEFGVHFTDLA